MLFRNIVFTAFFAAVLSGLLLGTLQILSTSQIIYSAEKYEVSETPATAGHGHRDHPRTTAHSHQDAAWGPEDGAQRIGLTYLADVMIAFGHGLLLTSFMALVFLLFNKPEISWRSGLGLGLAGYLSFYLATVTGLPPEVPGTLAADLNDRQIWWTLTVTATIAGLAILYLAPNIIKVAGLAFIALPHIIGAPHPETHGFVNRDQAAITALSQLEHQLLLSTAWVNLAYWLVLGLLCGLFASKILGIGNNRPVPATA